MKQSLRHLANLSFQRSNPGSKRRRSWFRSSRRSSLLVLLISLPIAAALLTLVVSASRSANPAVARQTIDTASKVNAKRLAGLANRNSLTPLNPPVPNITATLTDNITLATKVVPGGTINYTAVISNTTTDATGVVYTDVLDSHTTLVGGSVKTTPIAFDDAYSVIGNVRIQPNIAQGLLANDIDPDTGNNTGLTASTGSATSTQGGNVTVNSDGSFSYNPPAGYEGADSFTYTVTDTTGKTGTGTVNLTISGMVWFINNNAAPCTDFANGCGRLTNPYSDLASFNTQNTGVGNRPAANDNIFIYESASDYTGGVTLLSGQKLIGQDSTSTLSTITGLTPQSYSDPFPVMNSGNGTVTQIANGSGNGVTLPNNGNNTLNGFSVGDTSSYDISCTPTTSVGSLTIANVNLTGTGGLFRADSGGTLNVTFDSGATSSTGVGINGIQLTNVTGSFTVNGSGSISDVAGTGILVSGGSATVSVSSSFTKSSAGSIADIQSHGTNNVTLSGNLSCTSSCTGINVANNTSGTIAFSGGTKTINTGANAAVALTSNTGATINFTGGGLNIDTTTGAGFSATSGGTVNVTGSNNSINSTSATALNVNATTIGASNLTFHDISSGNNTAAADPANGIVLNATGASGSLIVTGDGNTSVGGNNSGGEIQHTTNYGISLTSTQSASFTNMNIHDIARNGVDGATGVVNFTFKNSTINNTGTAGVGQYEDNGIAIVDHASPFDTATITGNVSITQNTITQPRRIGIALETWSGTISNLTITNNTISGGTTTSNISHGIEVLTQGAAGTNANLTTATIQNNTISGFRFFDVANNFFIGGSGIFVSGGNTGNTNSENFGVLATPILVDNNAISNMGDSFIKFTFNGRAGQSYVNITNNGSATSPGGTAMTDCEGVGLSVFMGGGADAGHPFTGRAFVDSNNMNAQNRAGSSGLGVQMDNGGSTSDIPSVQFKVTNNTVSNAAGSGIAVIGINNNGTLNTTVQSNNVSTAPTVANQYGIRVSQNSAGPIFCAKISGNTSFGSSGAPGIGYRRNTGNTFGIDNTSGGSPGVDQYLSTQNPGSQLASGIFQNPADSNYYRAFPISQSTGFTSCTSTAMYKPDTNPREYLARTIRPLRDNGTDWLFSFLDTKDDIDSILWASDKPTQSGQAESTAGGGDKASPTTFARLNQVLHPVAAFAAKLNFLRQSEAPAAMSASTSSTATVNRVDTTHTAQEKNGVTPMSGETVTVNGSGTGFTLPAGKSITITYQATVNSPPLVRSVNTQGTVSGGNFANVPTTDPETGTAVPTVTNIDTTITWTGATSTDWNDATNWQLTGPVVSTYAPGVTNPAVNDVVIPNVGAQPNIGTTDIGIFSLNISNGRTLTITNPRILTIGGSPGGNLTLDGIISGGSLNMGTGTHTISNAGGTGSITPTNTTTVLSGANVTLNNNLQADSLTINSGGTLNITNRTLSLTGSLNNGGTFTLTGSTVIFDGTGAQTLTNTTAFNSLTSNNAGGSVTLGSNATVNGTLTLTSDLTTTNSFTLTMPLAGIISGGADVVGNFTRTNGGPQFPSATNITFGNPNTLLNFTAAGTRPTSINFKLTKTTPTDAATGGTNTGFPGAVARTYVITPTGGSGFSATMQLHYLVGELNGNSETNPGPGPTVSLRLYKLIAAGWQQQDFLNNFANTTVDTSSPGNHFVKLGALGFNGFSPWTIGGVSPTAATSTVSGRILDDNGNPVEGAGVRMSGTQNRLTVTDASGNYHFDNVETNGFYTVTPSRANFTFSPAQRSFSQLGLHTEAAFTADSTGDRLNPLDRSEYFVRQQYVDFLNREPDEAGFTFWVNNVESCGADAQCREVKRTDTSAAFFLSIEFQQTGYLVYRAYQSAYGDIPNTPVPLRLGEFQPDTRAIGKDVIVGPEGWEQTLENNKQAFMTAFVGRARFTSAYPTTMSPTGFVDKLFANAGVMSADADRMAAINEFGSAMNTVDTGARARALRRVAESAAVTQKEFAPAFVLMEYFGYLRRDPNSGPDTNFDGYNFWLNKLDTFGGNYQNAEMVKAFLTSIEYRGRFPR